MSLANVARQRAMWLFAMAEELEDHETPAERREQVARRVTAVELVARGHRAKDEASNAALLSSLHSAIEMGASLIPNRGLFMGAAIVSECAGRVALKRFSDLEPMIVEAFEVDTSTAFLDLLRAAVVQCARGTALGYWHALSDAARSIGVRMKHDAVRTTIERSARK